MMIAVDLGRVDHVAVRDLLLHLDDDAAGCRVLLLNKGRAWPSRRRRRFARFVLLSLEGARQGSAVLG
jgi:hypothetical protein